MDFAEDYRYRAQEEIQFAYWSQTQASIQPVATYYKFCEKLLHQSRVFISDEQRHDTKFVLHLFKNWFQYYNV